MRSVDVGGALIGVVVLLAAVPAAAQDAGAMIADAVAARGAGDYATAIALLEAADRRRPDDATILRLLGTTHAFAGAYSEAIPILRRAQELAPRDLDIAFALARAYLWAGRFGDARDMAASIGVIEPDNSDLPELVRSIDRTVRGEPGATGRPQVALIQSVADVRVGDSGRIWTETVAALSLPRSDKAILSAEAAREDRSGVVDTRLQLRLDRRVGRGRWVYLGVSATPNAHFRERWGIRGGGEARVSARLGLTLDLRYADFGTTDIGVVEPGIRAHTRDDRFSVAIKSIFLMGDGGHQTGWAFRVEAQPFGPARLHAGGATYPDTEAGIVRRVRSAFVGGTFPIGDQIVLRAAFEHENRSQSYRRNGATLGVSRRF